MAKELLLFEKLVIDRYWTTILWIIALVQSQQVETNEGNLENKSVQSKNHFHDTIQYR